MEKGEYLPHQAENEEHSSTLSVVTFKDINWVDRAVNIMDMGEQSVRVESDQPIDPGFVWFNDRVGGHKGGRIIWCKKYRERYRAVIQLVPLTRDEERLFQERILRSSNHRPHRSPEEIIASLTKSVAKKST